MSLRGQGSWKSVDLFEREARLLRSLSHPGIPSFVDAFNLDTPTDRMYTLVQRLAPGDTLQALVDSGAWRPDEAEIERIAASMLDILGYLHGLRPPVVHRDVKPSNVLYDRASGRVTLVDFGAVRDTFVDGSTMIGTFGYMPPEQACTTQRAMPLARS
jgi:serine/threonine protein kinase